MTIPLEASYRECQRLTRRTAKNFYYSFLVLPRAKRRAMCALYAFLRHTDDLGDSSQPVDVRREALRHWRASPPRAPEGGVDGPLFPAVVGTAARVVIPPP